MPVDQAARAIVRLAATGPDGISAFHESARQARHWRESVLRMNLFGYPVALVSHDRWLEQLAAERYFNEFVAAGFLPPPRRGSWSAIRCDSCHAS